MAVLHARRDDTEDGTRIPSEATTECSVRGYFSASQGLAGSAAPSNCRAHSLEPASDAANAQWAEERVRLRTFYFIRRRGGGGVGGKGERIYSQ